MCETVITSKEKNIHVWSYCDNISSYINISCIRDISLRYLEDQSPLCSEAVLQEEGALVSCHAVEEHSQNSTQNTFF